MAFCTLPAKPKKKQLLNAFIILQRACESAQSFFDAFTQVRSGRTASILSVDSRLIRITCGLPSPAPRLASRPVFSNW